MNIIIEFVLVILVASIVIFFFRDIGEIFKKIFAIPGAVLLIPLFIMSWLTMYFQRDIWYVTWNIHAQIESFIDEISANLPFLWQGKAIISIILLTVVSVFPAILIEKIYWRRYLIEFSYGYQVSTFIWIIVGTLLIMKP